MLRTLKNWLWHLPQAIFWNFYYSFPSRKLTLIGVTGTDGKTSTCTLLHKLLENSGIRAGIISTINSPGQHTTSPSPKVLQKIFYDYLQSGHTHVVCEVTSHALSQFRYWGCNFNIGIITNISHEHMDYHKSMDQYVKVKRKLFTQSRLAILNHDDEHFSDIKKNLNTNSITYGVSHKSDYTADKIKINPENMTFRINRQNFTTDSNYYYQIYNILACFAAFSELKLDTKIFAKTIAHFPEIKGRMELVDNNLHLRCIIDFAHTPNALSKALSSLKQSTKGKLIVIFGATGERDKSKRPLMGDVVSKNADIAIITSDDTRSEDINIINDQIISGINPKKSTYFKPDKIPENQKGFLYTQLPNRQDAFNLAIKIAKSGDTVISCGKGHETSILLGKTDYPWSESEAFRTAFRLKKENV